MQTVIDEKNALRNLARNVARLREDRGWSKAALAREAKIPKIYVTRIESAAHNIETSLLVRIANTFDEPIDRLLADTSEKKSRRSA